VSKAISTVSAKVVSVWPNSFATAAEPGIRTLHPSARASLSSVRTRPPLSARSPQWVPRFSCSNSIKPRSGAVAPVAGWAEPIRQSPAQTRALDARLPLS
jgi:hypothetical protein